MGSNTREGAGLLDTGVSTAGNSAEAASRSVEPRLPSGEHIISNLASTLTEDKRNGGGISKASRCVRHES